MLLSDTSLKELLGAKPEFPTTKLDELMATAAKSKEGLQNLLYKRKLISEKDLTKLYAGAIKAKFAELGTVKIDPKLLELIPEHIARQYKAVVFGRDATNKLKLALADPGDLQAVDFLEKLLGKNLDVYIATETDIAKVLGQYRGNLDIEGEITKAIPTEATAAQEVSAEEVAEDSPVAKTVNLIVQYAIQSEASDIHIEPREEAVHIRYRVDGILREANTLPRNVLAALVSRIKIMANLKIDEHRKPQDGRFKITDRDRTIAIRVSTLPIMDGEKVVMRLLDESSRAQTLEELGFDADALSRMHHAMVQPHGMILVTGPTGSGKSTTLYSVLSTLNTAQVNISTVEDPVEYRIVGVNQTQVNPVAGMNFATGLRALLRQDPNIIMVGEVRDSETADLAIQAALTGHLVLSTLHTNNAATSLPRLLDMGAEPFLIASTVQVVVGQRLVRKLCSNCRTNYEPKPEELTHLKQQFMIDQAMQRASAPVSSQTKTASAAGATGNMAGAIMPEPGKLKLWKAGPGCQVCGGSGYKGRIGIYEVLEISEPISELIVSRGTSEQINKQAIAEGMLSMQNDGLVKVLRGLTTIEEILRVTRD